MLNAELEDSNISTCCVYQHVTYVPRSSQRNAQT